MVNVEHVQKTLALIKAHPRNFDMAGWAWHMNDEDESNEDIHASLFDFETPAKAEACGTTLCAAGFASVAAGNIVKYTPQNGISAFNPITGEVVEPKYRSNEFAGTAWYKHGANLLGLDIKDAAELFVASEYRAIQVLELMADGVPDEEWQAELWGAYYEVRDNEETT